MSEYKIEAGTAQHVGSRPRQHDRTALFTAPRAREAAPPSAMRPG